jgi:hypothetical protein
MRKILLLFSALAVSLFASAQVTSISVETFYEDDGSVTGYPAGFTTYRIYANCTNPNDVVASVIGNDGSPLALSVSGGVWNHPGGGVIGTSLNASLFGIIPALQYDSFVTIGRASNADPGATVYTVEDPGQVWTAPVFNTTPLGATSMTINTVVGGAWFAFPGDPNAFAGDDLKVLIAQITTDGSICGNFNLQVFPNWDSFGDPDVIQTNITLGTGEECGTPGCTDPEALNFDPEAGFNNGICIYECAIEFSLLEANAPTCGGDTDGSIYFEGTGGQDFIQYFFNGIDGGLTPDLYDNLGNGTYTISIHDTRFDNELFNPEGIYGTCTVEQEIVFDVQPLAFGAVAPTNVSCGGLNDGCITSSITGGVGELSFSVLTCADAVIETDLPSAEYCGLGGGSFKFTVVDENGCEATSACATVTSPVQLILNLGANSTTDCPDSEDGQQVVTWTGGTGDVDFSLEDDGVYDIEGNLSNVVLGNLAQGEYTVYAADVNGCEASASFTIGGPEAIAIDALVINPSCVGSTDGSAVVSATGGTFGVQLSTDGENFSSSLELTGLGAGEITIFALDGVGCTAETVVSVVDPTAVEATAVASDITCFGNGDGVVTINATGGTGIYSYSFDGGETFGDDNTSTGLAAGDYSGFVVEDSNGCSVAIDGSVSVGEPNILNVNVSVTDPLCNGDSGTIDVVADGGTPNYEYSVDGENFDSSSSIEVEGGEYTVTVMDANGCTVSSETVTVTEPDAISINGLSADPIDETPGGSSSFDVTGGTGDYTFEWTDSDGNVVSTSQNLSGLDEASDAGTYTLTVTDENGCSASQTITITGLGEINFGVATVLVPNPTMGQFQIRFSGLTGERLEYRIVDTQGRTILFSDLGNAGGQRTETLDISGVAAGIYYVQINIAGNTHSLKLIKQ